MGMKKWFLWSIPVALVALGLNLALTPVVVWHEGPVWEEFLKLYDRQMTEHFGGCQSNLVETTFGLTQIYACGDPSGRPVLLQGGAGSSCVVYTNWILPKLVDKGHYVLAVDFVCDLGRSIPRDKDKANCPKTPDDLVSWLKQVIAAYDLAGRVSLVGYSYGAFIAATAAVKDTAMVDKVVLMAPAAVFAPVTGAFIMRALFHTLVYAGPTGFALEDWLHADPDFNFARDRPENEQAFQRAVKKASLLATTIPPADPFSAEDLSVLASRPTLLIIGEKEVVVDPQVAIATAKQHPGITVQAYKDSGHLLIIEQHRKTVEDEIVSFLGEKGSV